MADLVILIAALPEKRQRTLAQWWTPEVEMVEDMETMTREEFDRLRELKAAEHSRRMAEKRQETPHAQAGLATPF